MRATWRATTMQMTHRNESLLQLFKNNRLIEATIMTVYRCRRANISTKNYARVYIRARHRALYKVQMNEMLKRKRIVRNSVKQTRRRMRHKKKKQCGSQKWPSHSHTYHDYLTGFCSSCLCFLSRYSPHHICCLSLDSCCTQAKDANDTHRKLCCAKHCTVGEKHFFFIDFNCDSSIRHVVLFRKLPYFTGFRSLYTHAIRFWRRNFNA